MEGFKHKHNATTLELPLTEKNFGLPINDQLFKSWDSLTRPKKPPKSLNTDDGLISERKVIENRVEKHFYGPDKAHFKFHLKFGKFKQVFRTKENLAKFILNLLNGLSLWLSISFFQTFVLKSGLFDDCDCVKATVASSATFGRRSSGIAVIDNSLQSRNNSI